MSQRFSTLCLLLLWVLVAVPLSAQQRSAGGHSAANDGDVVTVPVDSQGFPENPTPKSDITRFAFSSDRAGRADAMEIPSCTLFGYSAGNFVMTGISNTFVGAYTGTANTAGHSNSFFGHAAGTANTTGIQNCLFGAGAGQSSNGSYNAFFGNSAGHSNGEGYANSFFGNFAGYSNTWGYGNAFVGDSSGGNNTLGSLNSFFGTSAGHSNTTGSTNSFIGAFSDGAAGLANATAIGYRAAVNQSNSLILGSVRGINGATEDTFVGIGTTAPGQKLEVRGGHIRLGDVGGAIEFTSGSGGHPFIQGTVDNLDIVGGPRSIRFIDNAYTRVNVTLHGGGNVGIGTQAPEERLHVVGNALISGNLVLSGDVYRLGSHTALPDYVFEPGYALMPLEELAGYVSREKHLPNIPSAAEAKSGGVNLTDLQMKLLGKIEELTLYTIEQAKTIKAQQERLSALEVRESDLAALKAQNTALEARLRLLEQVLVRHPERARR